MEHYGYGEIISGQLGQNLQRTRYSSPVQVPGTTWSKVGRVECYNCSN